MTKNITEENFQTEVNNSDIPVLVDFSASWCGPCRAMSTVLDKLSKKHDKKIKIVKLDIDESPLLAQEYEVRAVPTFVFIKNGKEISRFIGGGISVQDFEKKFSDIFDK